MSSRFTKADLKIITNRLYSILSNEHRLHPFPYDAGGLTDPAATPVEVYKSLLPRDVMEHVEWLRQTEAGRAFLQTSNSSRLAVSGHGALIINSDSFMPVPYRIETVGSHVDMEAIAEFFKTHNEITVQRDADRRIIYHVITLHCSTAGQLKRVWPELEPYLPERYGQALSRQVSRSPVPKGLNLTDKLKQDISDTTARLTRGLLADSLPPLDISCH
jgi:hypothetical protein